MYIAGHKVRWRHGRCDLANLVKFKFKKEAAGDLPFERWSVLNFHVGTLEICQHYSYTY